MKDNNIEKSERKVIRCEIFSRVCGYFRPVDQYNKGKREEFKDKVFLDPNDIIHSMNKRFEENFKKNS